MADDVDDAVAADGAESVPSMPRRRKRRPVPMVASVRPPLFNGATVRYDSLEALPAVELDENGYAVRPGAPEGAAERGWSLVERQVRFVLFWNYSCGNMTVACQEAGVSRAMGLAWAKEPLIARHMEQAREEIADRLLLRVAQRTGLLPLPEGVRVHDASLFGLAKKYKPDMFGDVGGGPGDDAPKPKADSNIPRPVVAGPVVAGPSLTGTAGGDFTHKAI